jgi:ornithine decarboxylase
MMTKYLSNYISLAIKSYRPIAVLNEGNVFQKFNTWKYHLPYIKPYYAIKSLSEKSFLDTMSKLDIGFDVASKNEMRLVSPYNKPMILSNPTKTSEDILHAKHENIKWIVCDDLNEIKKVKSLYPNADIIWRIKSVEKYSTIKFNHKFGATLDETREILKLPFNIKGISFHVGSKCNNIVAYIETIDIILNSILPLFQKYNKSLDVIDIGGGFTNENDIIELSKELFPINNHLNIQFIAEPGRYFSMDSLDVFTKVIRVTEKRDVCHVFVNDSVYNTFSGKVYDNQKYSPIPLYTNRKKRCIIWGNTCDSSDVIVEDIMMPVPEENDILLWNNVGAYTIASSVDGFNGFNKAITVL